MTDEQVIDAFNKALINRRLEHDGIFHSARGGQYTSNDYEQLFSTLSIKRSYSKSSSLIFKLLKIFVSKNLT